MSFNHGNIKVIGDLFYFSDSFSFGGEQLPFTNYYKIIEVHKDDLNNITSVDIELVFEPNKYLKGEEYINRVFNVKKSGFNDAINGALLYNQLT